ncbi:hypothetical protein [Thiomicrorhabdus sp.]|uniref:hypothetical protein n=1 Tax=Thiomicrorhabdus sp. TaxID=2039724 RepID=UPI002AA7325A|nr:hypothetical protein [Thiomicrorhabdus sp.]
MIKLSLTHLIKYPLLSFSLTSVLLTSPIQTCFAEDSLHNQVSNQAFSNLFVSHSSFLKDESAWIGQRIYQNECAANPKYLTYWGKGEDFPSLGIGHFIWYPGQVKQTFQETFPQMVAFVSQYKTPPVWLTQLKPFKAPWQTKDEFYQAWSNKPMQELRTWLLETQPYQAEFIIQQSQLRLSKALEQMTGSKAKNAKDYQQMLNKLFAFKEGRFAVIDYINFKGVGNASEQYQGEQWGLFSVLSDMLLQPNILNEDSTVLLQQFVKSAKTRLSLRVKLAPIQRDEQRWLRGWFTRLDGYLLTD